MEAKAHEEKPAYVELFSYVEDPAQDERVSRGCPVKHAKSIYWCILTSCAGDNDNDQRSQRTSRC